MWEERTSQFQRLLTMLREGERTPAPAFTLRASQRRAGLMARLFQQAYRPDVFVAWRSPFVPTEILYAMDIVPFFPEAACAMLANSGLVTGALDTAREDYYSADTCSFLRCVAGASREDFLPTPDILICASICCEGAPKTFYDISKAYGADYFLLDVPYHCAGPDAVDYLARQIEEMVRVIEERMGRKLEPERLKKAIHFSNKAREYFLKVNQLRMNVPTPLSGKEAIDYAAAVASTWGTEKIVEIYALLYEEVKARIEKNDGSLAKQNYRILWRHLRPYYGDAILDYLEDKCQAVIAFEDVNCVSWDEIDAEDPYRGLARKVLANPGIGGLEHWIDATLSFVESYKIDGVVDFGHWGCRHFNSAANMFKQELDKKGIPFLVLDSDCIDARDFSWGQIKTRIDAFLEVLEKRKVK